VLPNVHAFDPPPPPPVAPTPPRKPTIESGVIEPVADAPVLAMDPMSSGATSASTGSQPNAGTAAESGIAVSIPDEPATIVPWQADHDPALVRADKPVYPDLAVQAQVEGDVYLRLLVGVDGRVMEVTVLRGVPMLDGAAVSAARTWVFTPAVFNGRPARVLVDVPVKFRLH
jgi:protein TonB